jgi:NADPH:quinone reductase-like Zn-dependent oxidoreductase
MTAEAIDEFGPPEVIRAHTLPLPPIAPTEVLIALRGAGVGIWDAKIRDGSWAPKNLQFPFVLGTDGAGFIAAVGTRVRRFAIGDRVWSFSGNNPKGGFYAEYVVVSAHDVGLVPKKLDIARAGVAVAGAMTALQGLDDHLDIRPGERVLIVGASGAVGTYAVELAKHRGAYVIATASGRDAQELVRQLGADAVIDVRDPRGLARLDQLAPHDLDAVLALVGGDTLEHCIDHVRAGGRVAYPRGVEPPPARRPGLDITKYDAVPGPREFDRLAKAFVEAHLHIPIAAEYTLAHAADAHRRLERGHVLGRIGLHIARRSH